MVNGNTKKHARETLKGFITQRGAHEVKIIVPRLSATKYGVGDLERYCQLVEPLNVALVLNQRTRPPILSIQSPEGITDISARLVENPPETRANVIFSLSIGDDSFEKLETHWASSRKKAKMKLPERIAASGEIQALPEGDLVFPTGQTKELSHAQKQYMRALLRNFTLDIRAPHKASATFEICMLPQTADPESSLPGQATQEKREPQLVPDLSTRDIEQNYNDLLAPLKARINMGPPITLTGPDTMTLKLKPQKYPHGIEKYDGTLRLTAEDYMRVAAHWSFDPVANGKLPPNLIPRWNKITSEHTATPAIIN